MNKKELPKNRPTGEGFQNAFSNTVSMYFKFYWGAVDTIMAVNEGILSSMIPKGREVRNPDALFVSIEMLSDLLGVDYVEHFYNVGQYIENSPVSGIKFTETSGMPENPDAIYAEVMLNTRDSGKVNIAINQSGQIIFPDLFPLDKQSVKVVLDKLIHIGLGKKNQKKQITE